MRIPAFIKRDGETIEKEREKKNSFFVENYS